MKSVLLLLVLMYGNVCVYAQSDASLPGLNSKSGAKATAFLDFDGALVRGTAWNWDGPINAEKSDLSNPSIREIFNRVAEDFSIFDLNITTDSLVYDAAPLNKRLRVIITPTHEWYGLAGGVSFIGSFQWGDDTPCWVFSTLLVNNKKFISEAISHEIGHCFGLQHHSEYDEDCNKVFEYLSGKGEGQTSWSPIMGVSYYHNLSTWYNGESSLGCHVKQDDISMIAAVTNGVGLTKDDHPDSMDQPTGLLLQGSISRENGLINSEADKDVYSFRLDKTSAIEFKLNPGNVGNDNEGADVDLKLTLYNQAQLNIGAFDSKNALNVELDTTLSAGLYYAVVEGVGNENMPDYASVGSYNLEFSILHALAVSAIHLNGANNGNSHQINWDFTSDEIISQIIVEASENGIDFEKIAMLPAAINSYKIKNPARELLYYRVKVVTATGNEYYSNVILLKSVIPHEVIVLRSVIGSNFELRTKHPASYWLYTSSGILIQQGNLRGGYNSIAVKSAKAGIYFLKVSSVSGVYTFPLMKE